MRTLAIGDIHGCVVAFECLVEAARLTPKDRVIFLGDYIDRGLNSKAVVTRLLSWVKHGSAIALRGNHEAMILSARVNAPMFHGWRECGGKETLQSYGTGSAGDWRATIPKGHWNFFERTRPWFETETHIFVHGSVIPNLDLQEQPEHVLYWDRFEAGLRHKSGKTVVCGHTAQSSGWPASGEKAVCIDTGAYFGEWLTCLDVDSGRFWQTNELAAVREGRLEEL